MHKKLFSAVISVILVLALCIGTCSSAFAASSGKKYVKEVILSYGNTAEEAKKWLTDNDYEVLDNNLNDGADDTFSTKRAVYLGYKTTDKASEAITDMKVMNMKGGYSIQDYQMLLSEQKDNLKVFFDNFKVAVQEYRNNYNAGQERAIAAHDMLNMLYDDDTKQSLGDILLNRVREEYTDEEYNALSTEEQAKVGDMTTILMQGNANAVLAMEQIIATATDESETPWANRYQEAKTYDEMLDDLMDNEDLTVNDAEKELVSKYDEDAKKIASNFENYKTYVAKNTFDDISLTASDEEIETYQKAHEDFNYADWYAVTTQCEILKVLTNDGVTLYDLIFGEDYDITGDDVYMLYPLVSVLSSGQRACLDFLSLYQLISLGINDDTTTKAAMEQVGFASNDNFNNISIYDGIDRSLFGGDIALTGEAYRFQASTGKNPMQNWYSSISSTTLILYGSFFVSVIATGISWAYSSHLNNVASDLGRKVKDAVNYTNVRKDIIKSNELSLAKAKEAMDQAQVEYHTSKIETAKKELYDGVERQNKALSASNSASTWAKIINVAKVGLICVMTVLLVASIWSTVDDIIDYYNATYTPIPSNMVNQGVNEKDEKVYTYYKAVKCNRVAQNMVTDKTELLGDNGDLNGDVGKQWVALYTTTDSAAGDPITNDFRVQYNNTKIPDDRIPLSIFCESTVQNLTNEKSGYTYSDGKNGIYLFYSAEESAFAGSVISDGGYYVLVGGGCAIVAAAIAFFVGKSVGKKGKKGDDLVNA